MLLAEAIVVFVLMTVLTTGLGWRLYTFQGRAAARLRERTRPAERFLPSPSLIWRQLVDRVGSLAPASPRDLKAVERRLVRAGFRGPRAARVFNGTRALLAAAGVALALALARDRAVLMAVIGGFIGYRLPMQYIVLRTSRRQHRIEKGLPNALDLMVVCVEAGLGLDQTTVQVAKELEHAHPEISNEFAMLNLELRAGKRRPDALRNLAERTGVDDLKKLVAVLIQADRFGTSIAQSLRGHSDYMRVMARQRAEERAAKIAVKLVFPIFFCILPSLFVVTVGPVLTRLIRDLIPMVENL
ncbi:MAG: type II secretion system F family protein [Bryobacteraceae bacterium]